MNAEKKFKLPNYRALILLVIFMLSINLSISKYHLSFRRLADGVYDFGLSIAFYFTELFTKEGGIIKPTVAYFPNISIEDIFPWNWAEFSRKLSEMWAYMFTKECFFGYVSSIALVLNDISFFAMFFVPIILMGFRFVKWLAVRPGGKDGEDTKPLRIFKKFAKGPFAFAVDWLRSVLAYCLSHRKIMLLLLLLWLCNLNIMTMILEFFAFYFYFIASFKLYDLFIQVVKLLVDLLIMFNGAPVIFWIIVGVFIFNLWRRAVGFSRLQHNEMKNRGFINSLPVVSMICGTMGAKKTTIATDMALSTEAMFRDEARDRLFKNMMKFPNFPWESVEETVRLGLESGTIRNLATLETHLDALRNCPAFDWKYDTELFREEYNDRLQISDPWDIVKTYASLFLIYAAESSLIISNYSIRTDSYLASEGHFPLWQSDFFKTKPGELPSRYSHILDFDLMRLGKTMQEDSEISGSFEFGVFGITEVGKERQNNLELKEVKKNDEAANQKNDLFNTSLKMARHPAVVDNYPFIKVITDEQRPESWGADARDLCTIVDVQGCDGVELAMPGFLFGDLFYDLFYGKIKGFVEEVRYHRGDNTLLKFIICNLFEKFLSHYIRTYNQFGVMKMKIDTRMGSLDAKVIEKEYYLMIVKIYAERFSTDCYAEFFRDKAAASRWSILFAPEYASKRATNPELKKQNSYFVEDMNKTFDKDVA